MTLVPRVIKKHFVITTRGSTFKQGQGRFKMTACIYCQSSKYQGQIVGNHISLPSNIYPASKEEWEPLDTGIGTRLGICVWFNMFYRSSWFLKIDNPGSNYKASVLACNDTSKLHFPSNLAAQINLWPQAVTTHRHTQTSTITPIQHRFPQCNTDLKCMSTRKETDA